MSYDSDTFGRFSESIANFLGTVGSGVWVYDMLFGPTSAGSPPRPSSPRLTAYPNPARDAVSVSLEFERVMHVDIDLGGGKHILENPVDMKVKITDPEFVQFALELLLRPDIQLVTMLGQAGTGKTLLALAVGLQLVAEEKQFRRIMVSRPIMPLGKDIGFLPGDIQEKMVPWMQPIIDNLDFLLGDRSRRCARNDSRYSVDGFSDQQLALCADEVPACGLRFRGDPCATPTGLLRQK